MRFRRGWAVLGAAILCTGSYVSAQETTAWQRFCASICQLRCWPEPYRQADRVAAREPFVIMKDNGWRLNNTLSDHFFSPNDQTLTRAGEIKVRWIATQAPLARRTVYVLRGETPDITELRVGAVQGYLSSVVGEGSQPAVLLTDVVPNEASGDYLDTVNRQFNSSVPAPRLPSGGPAMGSGGAGGGSN